MSHFRGFVTSSARLCNRGSTELGSKRSPWTNPRFRWLSFQVAAAQVENTDTLLHPSAISILAQSTTQATTTASSLRTLAPSTTSFYMRELPKHLIAFSSSEGRQLFREALTCGGIGTAYFRLTEQFTTQSEPAYCGLATLCMVLNSLNIDPGRVWKGPWRWFTEDNLLCEQGTCDNCLLERESLKSSGITMSEFVRIAKCNGLNVVDFRACDATLEGFRRNIISTTQTEDLRMVVSFRRSTLGQTGEGHFSPIAGYHSERDLVLVLDVARFKYPPFWVPVSKLWESMKSNDAITGESRGYCMVSNGLICPGVGLDLLKHDVSHHPHGSHSHDHVHGDHGKVE